MKYVLPLIAAVGVGCGPATYEPTSLETEVLKHLPGQELVDSDWQVYEECGADDSVVTCYRVFDGPNDEFFSINADKWTDKDSFAQGVDDKVVGYKFAQDFLQSMATRYAIQH